MSYSYDRRVAFSDPVWKAATLDETANLKGWETRREREERVRVNIPPELHALWERTKYDFKGSPDQRQRAFMDYVHDHPGEDVAILQDESDDTLDRMIREYERRPHHDSIVPFA